MRRSDRDAFNGVGLEREGGIGVRRSIGGETVQGWGLLTKKGGKKKV